MSAELLRLVTVERVNKRIDEYVEELLGFHDRTLDEMRLTQGKVAGLREAIQIQADSYRKMD